MSYAKNDEEDAEEMCRYLDVHMTPEVKRCMDQYTRNVRRRIASLFVPKCSYPGSTVIERITNGSNT